MKLTTKTRFGVRMLLDIALNQHQGAVQLNDVSLRQDISIKYLEQIIRLLKQARVVTSARGPKGGYRLARNPEAITLGQITRLFESPSDLVACLGDPQQCPQTETCTVRRAWQSATEALYEQLDGVTIADLMCPGQAGTDWESKRV